MAEAQADLSRRPQSRDWLGAIAGVVVGFWCAACVPPGKSTAQQDPTTLRIGISTGQMATADPQNGVRQVTQNQSVEALVRIADDGRPSPWIAESWDFSKDGRILRVHLRPHVTFHDGSPVTAATVADLLNRSLSEFMGDAFEDIEKIRASGENDLEFDLRRHSPFVLEALDIALRSPGQNPAGTGPFAPAGPQSPTELLANSRYYLGRPIVDRIAVKTFPTVRTAWAEMLRDHIDMLYDVGSDALDSLERSNQISVFTYTRPYQYALIFNTQGATFRSARIRQALDYAIDREVIVREALNGHGIASTGPIWPHHWALAPSSRQTFQPETAVKLLAGERLHFTCLVPADYERIALIVKRQLQAVGVSMDVKELRADEIYGAMARRDFEAVLFDAISGPSIFRPFRWWHSGTKTQAGFASKAVDAGLDQIRHSTSDDEYRAGVAAFQHATAEDPPAIFLAWSERARAVSKRFVVPKAEPGRDILSTVRFWKLVEGGSPSSQN
jgi:peptide/nickel transport system substrate-binding protein